MFQLEGNLHSAQQRLNQHPEVCSPGAGAVGTERTLGAKCHCLRNISVTQGWTTWKRQAAGRW